VQEKANKGSKVQKGGAADAPALGTATRISAGDWVHEDPSKDDDRAYYEQEVWC
jgi:hypothetical protein